MPTINHNSRHWSVILVVAAITAILLFSLFTYQISSTEYGIVLRFGKPLKYRDVSPGIHLKWPFEKVWRVDSRIHCFEGTVGGLEEVLTSDRKNIIVSAYLGWRVSQDKVVHFLERVKNLNRAEAELTTLLRNYKSSVIGKYNFSDIVNIDAESVKISEIEQEMHDYLKKDALNLFGIDVRFIGIKHIGLPEAVIIKVFDRMRAERETEVQNILAEGDAVSTRIRAQADKESVELIADAESKAKHIRAQGDAEAAINYEVFKQNPQLASFLRKLDSLKESISDKSVLILDTKTMPFDLLNNDALDRVEHESGKIPE